MEFLLSVVVQIAILIVEYFVIRPLSKNSNTSESSNSPQETGRSQILDTQPNFASRVVLAAIFGSYEKKVVQSQVTTAVSFVSSIFKFVLLGFVISITILYIVAFFTSSYINEEVLLDYGITGAIAGLFLRTVMVPIINIVLLILRKIGRSFV